MRLLTAGMEHDLSSVRIAPTLAPVVNDNLESWWGSTRKLIRKESRSAFDSLVILVCWQLWKQRNARVFHPATPSISASELVSRILDELRMWATAGGWGVDNIV